MAVSPPIYCTSLFLARPAGGWSPSQLTMGVRSAMSRVSLSLSLSLTGGTPYTGSQRSYHCNHSIITMCHPHFRIIYNHPIKRELQSLITITESTARYNTMSFVGKYNTSINVYSMSYHVKHVIKMCANSKTIISG